MLTPDFIHNLQSPPSSGGASNPVPLHDDAAFQDWLKPTQAPTEPGMLKSIVSPIATTIARPFQAAAELAGASDTDVNKYNLGGLIAPVPENAGDVYKDAGRATQTAALGLGPVAGGATYGLGSAMEAGRGPVGTIAETAAGAIGGKLLDVLGKPVFNAVGKVVDKVTPQFLQDLVAKGGTALTDFAKAHEILPKQISDYVNQTAGKVETTANKPFDAAKEKIVGTPTEQAAKARLVTQNDTNTAINAFAPKLTANEWNAARENGYIKQTTTPGFLGEKVGADDFSHNTDLKNIKQTVDKYGLTSYKITENTPKAKILNSVQDGISNISESGVKPLLSENPFQYNFADHMKMLDHVPVPTEITKNPIAFKAYQNAKQQFTDLFAKEFDKTQVGKPVTGVLDPNDYWKAEIGVDKALNNVLNLYERGTPEYNGVKGFMVNMRDASRQYLSDNIRFPNQPDKLDIYHQFLANPTGNIPIGPVEREALAEQIGLKATPESESAAAQLDEYMKDLHTLYDAQSNLTPWTRKEGGTGPVGRYVSKHPIAKEAIKAVGKAGTIGLGVGL